MTKAGAGQLTNSYNYFRYPKTGGSEFHQDETTTVAYATIAGGGEVNMSGWARLLISAGYRAAGSPRIPNGAGSQLGLLERGACRVGKILNAIPSTTLLLWLGVEAGAQPADVGTLPLSREDVT